MNFFLSSKKNVYTSKNNSINLQGNKEVKNFLKKGNLYKPNSSLNVLCNTQYNDNISNMNRQLSNISLNDKQILNISKLKLCSNNNSIRENNNNPHLINEKNKYKIIYNQSITYFPSETINEENHFSQNEELMNDNIKLKENIKFLLNQIKKYQKIGISNETESDSNNTQELRMEIFELKKYIKEYEIKLKKGEENLTNMMKENLYLRNYLNQRKTFEVLEEERNISLKYLPINFQKNEEIKIKNNKRISSLSQEEDKFKYIKKEKSLLKGKSTIFIKKSIFNYTANNTISSKESDLEVSINEKNKKFMIKSISNNNIKNERNIYSSNNNYFNKPDLSNVPLFLYKISNNNNNLSKGPKYKNLLYYFDVKNQKFNSKNYLEGSSSFNLAFNITDNHSNDIGLSISNGYLIITGKKTDHFYFYNSKDNFMYDLCNLNHNHCKGSLIKINNNTLLCLSGITSIYVEMYNIKENKWSNISKMNRPHSESSYIIINNITLYSFFGFDYALNRYIDFIEYYNLNKLNDKNEKWKIIKLPSDINIRGHGIILLNNNNKLDIQKLIILGGTNSMKINTGYIEIDINDKNKEVIQCKWDNYSFCKNSLKQKKEEEEKKICFSSPFYTSFNDKTNNFYSFNLDNELNAHIIYHNNLKHEIKKNTLKL